MESPPRALQPGAACGSHGLGGPQVELAERLLGAAVQAGGSRQVVSAVAATLWRLALRQYDEMEASLDDRVRALEPVLRAQEVAARNGHPQHTARGLVPGTQALRANAARHIFGPDFGKSSNGDMKRLQRGESARNRPRS